MGVSVLYLGVLFFLAHLLVLLFRKTKIPDVLFLTLLGFLVGPVLGWIHLGTFGQVGTFLSSIALVFLLFEGGIHLRPEQLSNSLKGTLGLALATFGVTVAAAALIGVYWLRLDWIPALTMGTILGGISPAVVIPLASFLGLAEDNRTSVIMESALTDVLAIILTFSLLRLGSGGAVEIGAVIGQVLAAFLFAVLIGLAGSLAWTLVLNSIRVIPNTIFSTLAFGLVIYGLTEFLGFSGAFAVLAFGFGLNNQKELGFHKLPVVRHGNPAKLTDVEINFFSEVTFVLKTFFFVYLGISFRWTDLSALPYVAVLLGVLFLARPFLVRAFFHGRTEEREGALLSVLVPKGLASVVLAGLPVASGMTGGNLIQSITVTTVILSVLATSVLVLLMEKTPLGAAVGRLFRIRAPKAALPGPASATTEPPPAF